MGAQERQSSVPWGDLGHRHLGGGEFAGAVDCPLKVHAVWEEGQAEDPENAPSSGADGSTGRCQGASQAQKSWGWDWNEVRAQRKPKLRVLAKKKERECGQECQRPQGQARQGLKAIQLVQQSGVTFAGQVQRARRGHSRA